jgi:hypothetical protein
MKQLMGLICLIGVISTPINAQNCKVLLPSIAGVYEGGCEKDKANGNGKSVGTDRYEGNFKNGYPDGLGRYTWNNGNFFVGNFKSGKRQGEGTMHYVVTGKADSLTKGFYNKDQYIGEYEFPYVIKSKSFGIKSASISSDSKQTPTLITIELSAVGSGTEDIKGTVPKPSISSIDVLKGNYQQKTEMTNMDKKNVYYLSNIKFPFTASFKIGDDELVVDFNNTGSWKVEIVINQ